MVNTTLSSIGGVLRDSRDNETIVTAIADGVRQAGDLVSILATGVIQGVDIDGSLDLVVGILLEAWHTDMDSVPDSGKVIEIVIPQGGHIYGVHVDTDQGVGIGHPMIYHASTAGILDEGTSAEAEHVARKFNGAAGDTYEDVIWGA